MLVEILHQCIFQVEGLPPDPQGGDRFRAQYMAIIGIPMLPPGGQLHGLAPRVAVVCKGQDGDRPRTLGGAIYGAVAM